MGERGEGNPPLKINYPPLHPLDLSSTPGASTGFLQKGENFIWPLDSWGEGGGVIWSERGKNKKILF